MYCNCYTNACACACAWICICVPCARIPACILFSRCLKSTCPSTCTQVLCLLYFTNSLIRSSRSCLNHQSIWPHPNTSHRHLPTVVQKAMQDKKQKQTHWEEIDPKNPGRPCLCPMHDILLRIIHLYPRMQATGRQRSRRYSKIPGFVSVSVA